MFNSIEEDINTTICFHNSVRKCARYAKARDNLNTVISAKQILIAEDDETSAFILKQLLLKHCYKNVDIVHDGLTALEMITVKRYDLLMSDIQMNGLTGTDLVKKIRSNSDPRISSLPVIGISGDIGLSKEKKFRAAGFNAFLLKPFKIIDLYKKIGELINPEKKLPRRRSIDPKKILTMITGNSSEIMELVTKSIQSLEEAKREWVTASVQADKGKAKFIVHKITPLLYYLNARTLQNYFDAGLMLFDLNSPDQNTAFADKITTETDKVIVELRRMSKQVP